MICWRCLCGLLKWLHELSFHHWLSQCWRNKRKWGNEPSIIAALWTTSSYGCNNNLTIGQMRLLVFPAVLFGFAVNYNLGIKFVFCIKRCQPAIVCWHWPAKIHIHNLVTTKCFYNSLPPLVFLVSELVWKIPCFHDTISPVLPLCRLHRSTTLYVYSHPLQQPMCLFKDRPRQSLIIFFFFQIWSWPRGTIKHSELWKCLSSGAMMRLSRDLISMTASGACGGTTGRTW